MRNRKPATQPTRPGKQDATTVSAGAEQDNQRLRVVPPPAPAETQPHRLLAGDTFFIDVLADLTRTGLVGEERNALVTYVAATSRLLERPISLFIKGPSGSGKNFLADRVLSLFPPSEYHKFESASDRSWNYAHDAFEHKVLYLAERNEVSGSVHPLRLLISEGQLKHFSTSWVNGERRTVAHTANGPIAAITATTSNLLEVDDETRQLSVYIDSSPEQTVRINKAEVLRWLQPPISSAELSRWHDLQLALRDQYLSEELRVSSTLPPWMTKVAELFPHQHPHSRRYWKSFLAGCYTIALLRQEHKEKKQGFVYVDFADVAVASTLFGDVISNTLRHQGDENHKIAYAIARISSSTCEPVTIQELASTMDVSYQRAASMIREAEAAGAIRCAKVGARNLKSFEAIIRPQTLPAPDELYHRLGLQEEVSVRHPVTGELMHFRKN
jgi:hypothetical protein